MNRLALITLVVKDYDEAIHFYTTKLNFTLVEDNPIPEQNKRWVTIRPRGGDSSSALILLAQASTEEQESRIGNQTGGRVSFFLETDDFQRDFAAFTERGVQFERGPKEESYGTVAVLRDLYGNLWDLIQWTKGGDAGGENNVVS